MRRLMLCVAIATFASSNLSMGSEIASFDVSKSSVKAGESIKCEIKLKNTLKQFSLRWEMREWLESGKMADWVRVDKTGQKVIFVGTRPCKYEIRCKVFYVKNSVDEEESVGQLVTVEPSSGESDVVLLPSGNQGGMAGPRPANNFNRQREIIRRIADLRSKQASCDRTVKIMSEPGVGGGGGSSVVDAYRRGMIIGAQRDSELLGVDIQEAEQELSRLRNNDSHPQSLLSSRHHVWAQSWCRVALGVDNPLVCDSFTERERPGQR